MDVVTVQGDTLDALCWRYLGSSDQVEAVMEMNRHVSTYGPLLPAGVRVRLPEYRSGPRAMKTVKLWD